MRLMGFVQFDDDEVFVLRRAMKGHEGALVDEPRNKREEEHLPVRSWLGRIDMHHEWLDLGDLEELEALLIRLVHKWAPEVNVEAWRKMAPSLSSAEALEGLAAERRFAIGRARDAIELVREAQREVRLVSGDSRKREEEVA